MEMTHRKEYKIFSVLNTAKVPVQNVGPMYAPHGTHGDNLLPHTLTNTGCYPKAFCLNLQTAHQNSPNTTILPRGLNGLLVPQPMHVPRLLPKQFLTSRLISFRVVDSHPKS